MNPLGEFVGLCMAVDDVMLTVGSNQSQVRVIKEWFTPVPHSTRNTLKWWRQGENVPTEGWCLMFVVLFGTVMIAFRTHYRSKTARGAKPKVTIGQMLG